MVFRALTMAQMHDIVDLQIKDVASNLLERGVSLEVSQEAKDWLVEKGYDKLFGARPLRRVIQDQVEDKLSDAVLAGSLGPGDTARVEVSDDQIEVKTESPLPVAPA